MSMPAVQQTEDFEIVVNLQIGDTLRVLMARAHQYPATAAPALSMSRSALYARLNLTTTWTAAEVKRAADVYRVPVSYFYDGVPGLRPDECARRDSNPQPSDPQSQGRRLVIVPDSGPVIPMQRGAGMNRPLLSVVGTN